MFFEFLKMSKSFKGYYRLQVKRNTTLWLFEKNCKNSKNIEEIL